MFMWLGAAAAVHYVCGYGKYLFTIKENGRIKKLCEH